MIEQIADIIRTTPAHQWRDDMIGVACLAVILVAALVPGEVAWIVQ